MCICETPPKCVHEFINNNVGLKMLRAHTHLEKCKNPHMTIFVGVQNEVSHKHICVILMTRIFTT